MAPEPLAGHGVEERKGGKGERSGAHPVRLSELYVKFLSQNVRGLTLSKEQELVAGMAMRGTFATMIKETWRVGKSMEVDTRGFTMLHNGLESKVCKRGLLGVATVLSPMARRDWEQCGSKVAYYDRIIAARLQIEDMVGKPLIIVLVSAYASHSGSTQEEKETFEDNFQACLDDCGHDEIPIIGMDAQWANGVRMTTRVLAGIECEAAMGLKWRMKVE